MQSSIKIDLNWENHAIIKIDKNFSEDVRDKLVNQFLHMTPFFKVPKTFDPGVGKGPLPDGVTVEIEPVHISQLPELILSIQEYIDKNEELMPKDYNKKEFYTDLYKGYTLSSIN
jgi:hypothetical protein